ncbi:hypothetical protein [Teredinibacter purpureus]|uniref:hypothetical protein n=1 Tax=Teredinibacter purpureus TaxID=2731756 RepID=UPI0005F7A597|nr:hypothetical protein [Teredinibacter purpureus]
MKKIFSILPFSIPFLCWGALSVWYLYQGNVFSASLACLPFIAFIFFIISPHSGPGNFAFTKQMGPVREEDETERQYHLKMAKWWLYGFTTAPLSYLMIFFFEQYVGLVVVFALLGTVFGIACLLKFVGSLYNAVRAKS